MCLIGLLTGISYGAPFGIRGSASLSVGDLYSVAGDEITGTKYEISLDREIPVNKLGIISVTPYVKGAIALEELVADETFRTFEIGADALVFENEAVKVSVGAASQRVYLPDDTDKTYGLGRITVDF